MLINEVCRRCGLTKKAVEYYVEQELLTPLVLENGYRDFSDEDISLLRKISVLRRLEVPVPEIRRILKSGRHGELKDLCEKRALSLSLLQEKQKLLEALVNCDTWENVREGLEQLDKKQSILFRLLERFPGYYGRYFSLHFAPYLNEPIRTEAQKKAFDVIVSYLDQVDISIPEDIRRYLEDVETEFDPAVMEKRDAAMREAIADPGRFVKDNAEMLRQYEKAKASEEYRATPAFRLQELIAQMNRKNGYCDTFIPAMCELSNSYREYHDRLLKANEAFLQAYRASDLQHRVFKTDD